MICLPGFANIQIWVCIVHLKYKPCFNSDGVTHFGSEINFVYCMLNIYNLYNDQAAVRAQTVKGTLLMCH